MLLEEGKSNFDALNKSLISNYGANKGGRGQSIEKLIGLPLGSKLTDFDDGEAKSFKEDQPIKITALLHCIPELLDRSISYSESKVGKKLKNVWFIKFNKDNEFVCDHIFNKDNFRQVCYDVSTDYNDCAEEFIRYYNNKEEIHTINGRNGYLQIRTNANPRKDGTYKPLIYNGQQIYHCNMAFYLRNQFAREILV